MLLTVIVLGATILGATTIGGLIMIYQIRQAADFSASAKAIFAADAGVECGLFMHYKPSSTAPCATDAQLTDANARYSITCYEVLGALIDCTDPSAKSVVSIGISGNSKRIFQRAFQ